MERKVSTRNAIGEMLVGLETRPLLSIEEYPAVVMAHGFGVTKSEARQMFDELAVCFAKEGIISYRFDFSGRGESEGDYAETSLSKLSTDLRAMLAFVKKQPAVDAARIGIHAHSLGTAATVALHPQVSAAVFTGSIAHPEEVMRELFADRYRPHEISEKERWDGAVVKLGSPFWHDVKNHKLLESIRQMQCPILFIHGGKDESVPVSEAEAYFMAAHEPKEKIILENADHSLRPERDAVYELSVNWFKKYLDV